MGFLIPLTIFLCIYFLPTAVAKAGKKRNTGAIFALNLFLGWTLVGWVIALVWSVSHDADKAVVVAKHNSGEELEKLAELKEKGILSDEEFQAKKKKVLEA